MKKNQIIFLSVLLAVIGIYLRLTPHPANFAPIGAIALFAGAYLPRKWAVILPLGILFITDLFLGWYEPMVMLSVYGCLAVSFFAGQILRKRKNFFNVFSLAVFSSILFFIVTNFAVWAASSWYPHTLNGLTLNYYLALPFFRNTLFSDIFYTLSLFGAYELVKYGVWQGNLKSASSARD